MIRKFVGWFLRLFFPPDVSKKMPVPWEHTFHVHKHQKGEFSATKVADISTPYKRGDFLCVKDKIIEKNGLNKDLLFYCKGLEWNSRPSFLDVSEEQEPWTDQGWRDWNKAGRPRTKPSSWRIATEAVVIGLMDINTEGRSSRIDPLDLRKATRTEVQNRLDYVTKTVDLMRKKVDPDKCDSPYLYVPTSTVLIEKDNKITKGSIFFQSSIVIRRGAEGIIDYNPALPSGGWKKPITEEIDDALIPDDEDRNRATIDSGHITDMKVGDYKLSDFVAPRLTIYLPDYDMDHAIHISYIKKRTPETGLIDRIVLPDGYMKRALRSVSRVVDQDVHEAIYDRFHMQDVCQKGRGSIVLLHGPPGTGKTMMAEVISEYLDRPLIKVYIGAFDGAKTQEVLKKAFYRASRYNAILLLDEVDVFIQRRGRHPLLDEVTSVFLRTLEYFDGILFLTTNLVGNIDPAIHSRVHVSLDLSVDKGSEKEIRKQIWKVMFPDKLLDICSAAPGTRGLKDQERDELFENLSERNLNGREIKMVLQNAVTRSVKEYGQASFLPVGVIYEEAEFLESSREALRLDRLGPEDAL